ACAADLVGNAIGIEVVRAPLRAEIEPLKCRVEGGAGDFGKVLPGYLYDRNGDSRGCQQYDLHGAAVFGDQYVARLGDRDVVDTAELRRAECVRVVQNADTPGTRVVAPDAVVALCREVDDT